MYRLSFMDRNGHVRSATDLPCETDDEAIDRAAAFRHADEMQVWEGERLVWWFEASGVAQWARTRHG
jgi:hypothetical protein